MHDDVPMVVAMLLGGQGGRQPHSTHNFAYQVIGESRLQSGQ